MSTKVLGRALQAVTDLVQPTAQPATRLPPPAPAISTSTAKPRTWTYQLQNIVPSTTGKSTADYAVVDYSRDSSDSAKFTPGEIASMRGANPSKKVLAYISIGEAEDYRWYWNEKSKNQPWFDKENPDWPGNYKVRFWHPAWQSIIFKYLDTIIAQGFDGIYMDIIDGYEYYNKPAEMVDFVRNIAKHTRKTKPDFLIFPQNGAGLLDRPEYVSIISGIGQEDLVYGEDGDGVKNSDAGGIYENVRLLKKLATAGKPVLAVEYLKSTQKKQVSTAEAVHGKIPSILLLARRDLDKPN
jgi:cysteinyl-tRNA synthetase, unknown class